MRWFSELSIKQNIVISMMFVVTLMLLFASAAYYVNFNTSMNNIVESSSKEVNKQIIFNYENYINDVINTARLIQQETIDYDIVSNFSEMENIYIKSTDVNENTVSIVLLSMEGEVLLSSSPNSTNNSFLEEKNWFAAAIEDDSIFHFSSPHDQDVYFNSMYEVISVTKIISYYSEGVKKNGVLLIDFSTEKIISLTHLTNLGEGGHIIILNDDNSLIYSSIQSCFNDNCESREIATNIIIGGSYVDIDGIKMYANVNTLNATRWRIATFTNVEIINTSRTNTVITLIAIMSITFTFVFFIANKITRRITHPLNKLNKHMLEIQEHGEIYRPLSVEGQKEIVVLSNAFNTMISEIRILMDRLLNEQKEKRKTEFIALQTQINPHFLYNTLDSIIWLSENNKNEEVIEMIIALSKYFRIGINKDEAGLITIKAFKNNGLMVFEIENNGYGLTDKQINEIYSNIVSKEKKTSIGLKNVYQRLKLYYNEKADLEIESILDEKTIIRLSFPINR